MGTCTSSPANLGLSIRNKRSSFHLPSSNDNVGVDYDYDYDVFRRSFSVFKSFNVLKEPDGTDIFSQYRLGKELGRGEFGITYECKDILTGETFACKSISKSRLRTQTDVEDVRREVEIMRHLPHHPNIVRYKEAYEDRESIHLVMELCQGGELFDRIVAKGHYSERAAAIVIKTIIEVIQVCHKHGVMHRDLKPENFLFASAKENCPLKTIDFGLSVFFKPGQRFRDIVGSPYYMAPEVLKRNYGPEVDIWSAGVILYILLCGIPPFWAATEEGIAKAIVQSAVEFKRDPWPSVSEDAKDLIRNMLDPSPCNRITAQEVLEHPWLKNAVPNIILGENVRARIKQFSLMNKFKKRMLRVLANNLPFEQVAEIERMFQMMDTDNNGKLTFQEIKNGLHMIGQPVPDQDVQLFLDAADIDKSGTLNSNDFVTVTVHLKRIGSDEQLSKAFSYFDKNGNGFIELEELREALLEDDVGPVDEQVIQDIICDVDTDKDGQINYEEFKEMMKVGMDWRMASRQYSRVMLNALSVRLFRDTSLQVCNCVD